MDGRALGVGLTQRRLKRVRFPVAKWKTIAKKYAVPEDEIGAMKRALEEEIVITIDEQHTFPV